MRRGSASMMLEYWKRPDATAEKFHGDWLITGDRGVWEGDYLRFVGREDDVITSGRVSHRSCRDRRLPADPPCRRNRRRGRQARSQLRTEIVKAYVVLKPGFAPASEKELQDWVKDRLAHYSYPREIAFLDALPMTVTGKVIRKELKARAAGEVSGLKQPASCRIIPASVFALGMVLRSPAADTVKSTLDVAATWFSIRVHGTCPGCCKSP